MAWKSATTFLSEEEAINKIRKKLRKEFTGFDEKIKEWYKNFDFAVDHNLNWAELAIATNRVYFPKNQNTEDFISPIVKQETKGKSQWFLIFKIGCKKNFEGDMEIYKEGIFLFPEKYKDLLEAEANQPTMKLGEWQDQF